MVELTNRGELEAWLMSQPYEVGIHLAVRAALRVLPLVAGVFPFDELKESRKTTLIFSNFHLSLSAILGTKNIIVSSVARNNLTDTISAISRFAQANPTGANYPERALMACHAARATMSADLASQDNSTIDGDPKAHSNYIKSQASKAIVSAAAAIDRYPDLFWKSISADVQWLENKFAGKTTTEDALHAIVDQPIWLESVIEMASSYWQGLKSKLEDKDEGWEVWIDWYEARLAGRLTYPNLSPELNESLEVAIATIPNDILVKGPAVLNAHIKKLIAEHEARQEVLNAQEAAIKALEDELENQALQNGEGDRFGMGGNNPPEGQHLDRDKAVEEAVQLLSAETTAKKIQGLTYTLNIIRHDRLETDELKDSDISKWEKYQTRTKEIVKSQYGRLKLIFGALAGIAGAIEGGKIIWSALKKILEVLNQYLGVFF